MIGSLRHRIELQKKTATRNSYGAETETWVTKATVWAAVIPLSELEYFTGKLEWSEITHKIILRYYEDLTPDWRIRFGTRIFNIYKVMNSDFSDKYLELAAYEQIIELPTIEWTGFLLQEAGGGNLIVQEDHFKIKLELHA